MFEIIKPRIMKFVLVLPAVGLVWSPAATADFVDDFDNAGDVASLYSYFNNSSGEDGSGVDSFTSSDGANFSLDTANSQVDFLVPAATAFNFLRLSRTGDATNEYDLTQGASLTVNASGLDGQNFGAPSSMRTPIAFGFAVPGSQAIFVQINHDNFSNDSSRIRVQGGGADLPGGAPQIVAVGPNNRDLTFNIDADSYSVVMGDTTVIADTLHGLTLDPLVGAIPFFEARVSFNSINGDFSVNSFAGAGTPVPEPAALVLMGLGGLAMMGRRRVAA